MTSTRSRTSRGSVRTRLVIPALLVGLVSATALATGATSASAATAGSALRAAEGDPCTFDWLCLPGQTPAPTATPTTPATTTPANPILPLPTPSPSTGTGSGGSSGGGLQIGAGTSESCDKSAFPTSAGSGAAKLDFAAAMGTCEKAVDSGDATVKAAAADGTMPTPTDHVTHIDASKLSVSGFQYKGLTTLTTTSGASKQVMIFTADKAELEDINQTYSFPGGKVGVRDKDAVAVLQGNVKLYVTTFTSKIFGLVQVTFDPSFTPPLVLPSMFFTEVSTDNAYITCDQILLSNASIPVTPS